LAWSFTTGRSRIFTPAGHQVGAHSLFRGQRSPITRIPWGWTRSKEGTCFTSFGLWMAAGSTIIEVRMSLESFSGRMRLRANRLEGQVGNVVKRAAIAIDQTLVTSTPVDTGRARSNWIVSLGTPSGETVGPTSEQAALSRAQQEIERRVRGQAIHITNNLPYIGRLNEGSSAQAPAGFVQAAVQQGVASIRGASIDTS